MTNPATAAGSKKEVAMRNFSRTLAAIAAGLTLLAAVPAAADPINFGGTPGKPSGSPSTPKADWEPIMEATAGAFTEFQGQVVLKNFEGACMAVLTKRVPALGEADAWADLPAARSHLADWSKVRSCLKASPDAPGLQPASASNETRLFCLITIRWKSGGGGTKKTVTRLASLADVERCAVKPPPPKATKEKGATPPPAPIAFNLSGWLNSNFQVPPEAVASVPKDIPLTSGNPNRADSLDPFRKGGSGYKAPEPDRRKAARWLGALCLVFTAALLLTIFTVGLVKNLKGRLRGTPGRAPGLGWVWRLSVFAAWFILVGLFALKVDLWLAMYVAVTLAAIQLAASKLAYGRRPATP